MAIPKVFQVVQTMNDKELAEIDALVKSQKRSSIQKLFKLICKSDPAQWDKLDKALLYTQVFGKKYKADDDYIWRNELKLLLDIIEKYAAEKMMSEEAAQNKTTQAKYFVSYLLSKKLYTMAEAEAEKVKRSATHDYDYRTVMDICAMLVPYHNNFSWNDMEIQERQEANNDQYRDAVNRQYLHAYRKTQMITYSSKLYKFKENFKLVIPEKGPDQYFAEYEDAYSRFLELRIKTIATPDMVDPDDYMACIRHLAANPEIPNAVREKYLLLNNLSGHYYYRQDYDSALIYNVELMDILNEVDPAYAVPCIYNYASNLAHLDRYQDAIDVMKQYDKLIKQYPNQHERFHYIETSCYALMGDKKTFNEMLPRQFDELSKMLQYHYRFLIAISHFLDKDYLLASTEVKNIERSIKTLKSEKLNYYDGVTMAAEHISTFIDIYQEYMLNGNKRKLKNDITKMEKLIDDFTDSQRMSAGLLFYGWMKKQVALLKEKVA